MLRSFDFGYLLAILLAFPFMGGIYGLVVYVGTAVMLEKPVWVLAACAFFMLFHITDFPTMRWRERLIRFLWVFTLSAVIVGIVWFFVPKEDYRPIGVVLSVYLIIGGVGLGFILGIVEGIKPGIIMTRLRRLTKWWKEIGGYY